MGMENGMELKEWAEKKFGRFPTQEEFADGSIFAAYGMYVKALAEGGEPDMSRVDLDEEARKKKEEAIRESRLQEIEEEKELAKVVDFSRLKGKIAERNMTVEEFAEKAGCSKWTIGNILTKRTMPHTKTLARICAELQCSVNDIVELRGFEVDERYGTHRTAYYPAVYNDVSYEPLRHLFKTVFRRKPNVKGPGSRQQLERLFRTAEIPARMQARIRNDDDIPFKYVYSICKVLRCTPDYVMEYK